MVEYGNLAEPKLCQFFLVNDEFYLNISTRRIDGGGGDTEGSADTGHPDQTVLGIDLGVNSLAVASTGTFWQGDDYDHWCREFEKRRGEMQRRGTRAIHEIIQSVGRTETGRYDHFLHTVSRELVASAGLDSRGSLAGIDVGAVVEEGGLERFVVEREQAVFVDGLGLRVGRTVGIAVGVSVRVDDEDRLMVDGERAVLRVGAGRVCAD